MAKLSWARGLLACVALMSMSTLAAAQSLPVSVNASGNTANVVIGLPGQTLADVSLVFNDVSGLSISNVVAGYPNMTNRTGASMYFVTNSPSITISAVTNLNVPPGGYILSTP